MKYYHTSDAYLRGGGGRGDEYCGRPGWQSPRGEKMGKIEHEIIKKKFDNLHSATPKIMHQMKDNSNLITVQQDVTYSVYYISVGSSTCFRC